MKYNSTIKKVEKKIFIIRYLKKLYNVLDIIKIN